MTCCGQDFARSEAGLFHVNEVASIALAERASVAPILANDVASDLADTYKLAAADLGQLFSQETKISGAVFMPLPRWG